jgi:hypothetical protein
VRSAGVLTMSIAYLIRRRGNVCAVVELHADNREEVVQDGLSPIEAEILCAAKIADLPRAAFEHDSLMERETPEPEPRAARQLTVKL